MPGNFESSRRPTFSSAEQPNYAPEKMEEIRQFGIQFQIGDSIVSNSGKERLIVGIVSDEDPTKTQLQIIEKSAETQEPYSIPIGKLFINRRGIDYIDKPHLPEDAALTEQEQGEISMIENFLANREDLQENKGDVFQEFIKRIPNPELRRAEIIRRATEGHHKRELLHVANEIQSATKEDPGAANQLKLLMAACACNMEGDRGKIIERGFENSALSENDIKYLITLAHHNPEEIERRMMDFKKYPQAYISPQIKSLLRDMLNIARP